MKKTMKKILCLALVLMMTLPFAAFPVNADSAYKTYDEAEDGDLLYAVNFNGTSGFYSPSDGADGWNKTNKSVSNDGSAVTVQYTNANPKGTDKERARFYGAISSYKINGKAYTVEFTINSTVPVGVHLDGGTGFIINPSQNKTWIGQSKSLTTLGKAQEYDGTGNSTQTYAIELKGGNTLEQKGNSDYDVYPAEVYKLYVKQSDGTWKLIREVDNEHLNYFDWASGDEFFYLSINRYRVFDTWNLDAGDASATSTVSDMKIYKGIKILDYYTPDEPEQPSSYESLFSEVKLQGYTNAGNKFSFGTDTPGSAAIDGVLHDSIGFAGSANYTELTKNTFFDGNGQIACNVANGNYYGVIIAELKELTILDTFTVWTPNGLQSIWFDNVAYDIYYSIDGKSFASVDGASFDDVRGDAHYEAVNESDFLGEEATSGISDGEFAGKIYKNEIPMNRVTAKYVAIAVKETLPKEDLNEKQIVLYEITATGTPATMYLESGASVRTENPTGLRFTGLISKSYVDGLESEGKTVTMGMLITPTEYLENVDEFTKSAFGDTNYNPAYLEIDAAEETVKEDGDYYKIKCVIADIQNYEREFSAILYVKVDGGIVAYSHYNEVFNSRSVAEVAEAAYYDLKDTQDATYANQVTVSIDGVEVTKYSRYTQAQVDTLHGFFGQGEQ